MSRELEHRQTPGAAGPTPPILHYSLGIGLIGLPAMVWLCEGAASTILQDSAFARAAGPGRESCTSRG
jgi:hypothetical protein